MKTLSKIQKNKKGFTLIEMLISTTIFVIVVTLGINAVVSIHKTFKVTKAQKEGLDIINSVMEDMVRNIRLGRNFRADIQSQYDASRIETPKSCPMSPNWPVMDDTPCSLFLAFEGVNGVESNPNDQITYAIGDTELDGNYSLYKTLGPDPLVSDQTKITPDIIHVDATKSGFNLVFTDFPQQDLVTIKLVGSIVIQDQVTPFYIQTAVSPRSDTFDTTETQNPTP